MPFFNYGGACADTEENRYRLIEEAVRIAKDIRVSHIELRQESPLQNGFPSRTSKVSMRLDLPSSPEDLMRSFPSKLRSQVRKPQKEGMTTRIGRFEELDGFHHVFSVNMRKLGTPALPKGFFRDILVQFPDESWICSVYLDSVPVASGFLIAFKNRLEIPWASSLSEYNKYSPNMLLYWSCLEFACRGGFKVFDFGRSTAGGKTCKFKEQWGARPVQLHWHYWLRDGGGIPDLTPGNPKYQLAIALWKRLPLSVTKIIGPRIIRNIP
jgi:FemAB-related protein (PEP-CTERM system-associated)